MGYSRAGVSSGQIDSSRADPSSAEHDWSDRAMARLVPLVPATLGAVMICLALAHLLSVVQRPGSYLSLLTATGGIALCLASVLWRRHRLSRGSLHAILSTCLVLAATDTLAFSVLTRSLERTADLMLLVVATGLVLLDRAWYRFTLTVIVTGWGLLAAASGPVIGYQIATLGLSTILGAAARSARLAGLAGPRRQPDAPSESTGRARA